MGVGYDVHPLVSGRRLVLGGIEIPFDKGLEGHSDADVLVHAIMDALLGAIALPDIGQQFPSAATEYKDISSIELLRRVRDLLYSRGWQVGNIDATIIAEQPKLAPWVNQMRQRLSQTLGIEQDQIGVKATTSEGLGFTGRGEGMAAHAVALVIRREKNNESI